MSEYRHAMTVVNVLPVLSVYEERNNLSSNFPQLFVDTVEKLDLENTTCSRLNFGFAGIESKIYLE